MSPSHQTILRALATATATPLQAIQDCSAFAYPLHRRPEHDGWTTGLIVPRDLPVPDPAVLAAALDRPAGTVRAEAIGACLFLTILDRAA